MERLNEKAAAAERDRAAAAAAAAARDALTGDSSDDRDRNECVEKTSAWCGEADYLLHQRPADRRGERERERERERVCVCV